MLIVSAVVPPISSGLALGGLPVPMKVPLLAEQVGGEADLKPQIA